MTPDPAIEPLRDRDEAHGAEDLLHDGAPDWERIEFDVRCARCDYLLRGLLEPRCPECGLSFDWTIVLKKAQERGTVLFEHAWRHRPVRAWFGTMFASLRPVRFWRAVSIHERIDATGLWLMLGATLVFGLTLAHLIAWGAGNGIEKLLRLRWMPTSTLQFDWWTAYYQLARFAKWPLQGDFRYLYLPLGLMLGALGILGVLSSLRQTLGRCRVRREQLLRVVAYASGPIVLWFVVLLLVSVATVPTFPFRGRTPLVPAPRARISYSRPGTVQTTLIELSPQSAAILIGGILASLAIASTYLVIGLRCYLRLPRAAILGVVSTCVAGLFSYTVLLIGGMIVTGAW